MRIFCWMILAVNNYRQLAKSIARYTALVGIGVLLVACGKANRQVTLVGQTMGTYYQIKYITVTNDSTSPKEKQIHNEIERRLEAINDSMSTYRDNSEISRFNRSVAINTQVDISADLATVIAEAIRINKLTDGALDITIGPLVNLWGFGSEQQLKQSPSAQDISRYKKLTGIDKLTLTSTPALSKANTSLYIDLSSIAKGFAVDKIAEYFDSIGVNNYLVEIGGDLRTKGKGLSQKSWLVAIEMPEIKDGRAAAELVPLSNLAIATSGDYRNYFEQDGVRYSHIIDPKTGRPIQHNLASVSVVADNCISADGWATGLLVLGAEKALAIAEQQQLAVLLLIKTDQGFEPLMSSAFEQLLQRQEKEQS